MKFSTARKAVLWSYLCRCRARMAVEIVAPVPRRAPQGTARTALAGATALLLTLAVAATLSKSAGTAGVELAAAGHDTERLASAATGHYFANGKEHFFKLTGPPSAYMDPNDNGQTEYRSASTSGLGFAGGGDPYKYIETGHYAKILAHENQVQKGWYNGTFAKQGVKQALASIRGLADLKRVNQHEIRARDETLLQLLSAPVSASELKAVLPKGGKKMEAVQVRDLNQYIKQQVDNFTPAERKKLESLDPAQLRQLKSSIVSDICVISVLGGQCLACKHFLWRDACSIASVVPTKALHPRLRFSSDSVLPQVKSTVRATALHEEAGTNVFAKKAAKPVSVEQEVIAAKKRAASMMHHNTQQTKAAAIKGTKAQPKIVKGKVGVRARHACVRPRYVACHILCLLCWSGPPCDLVAANRPWPQSLSIPRSARRGKGGWRRSERWTKLARLRPRRRKRGDSQTLRPPARGRPSLQRRRRRTTR